MLDAGCWMLEMSKFTKKMNMNNPERSVGSEYAHLWALDPEVVYLNHGSFGACPKYIVEKRAEYLRMLEAQPMNFLVRELEERVDSSRKKAADDDGMDGEAERESRYCR